MFIEFKHLAIDFIAESHIDKAHISLFIDIYFEGNLIFSDIAFIYAVIKYFVGVRLVNIVEGSILCYGYVSSIRHRQQTVSYRTLILGVSSH